MTVEARIETEAARHYLVRVSEGLRAKAEANPEVRVHVEWADDRGVADFGWGRCTMRAASDALTLRVEGDDREAVQALQELFTRHLEKLGEDEHLSVRWQQASEPAREPSDAHYRRDRMRSFHRRARHSG